MADEGKPPNQVVTNFAWSPKNIQCKIILKEYYDLSIK